MLAAFVSYVDSLHTNYYPREFHCVLSSGEICSVAVTQLVVRPPVKHMTINSFILEDSDSDK
jgi:hypothetical protein